MLGEEEHLNWSLDVCLRQSSATLLPGIIAPCEESTIGSDAHCVVHTEVDLLDRTYYLSHERRHSNIGRMSAQLTATK